MLLAGALAGCATLREAGSRGGGDVAPVANGPTGAATTLTPTIQDPGDVKYYPSDQPLHLGLEHFSRGNYGIAQRYFRDAVEKAPKDATAWVGLAASYDRLRRF